MKSSNLRIEEIVKLQARNLNITTVLVALSGGADSITAAYALNAAGLDVLAAHCNFHLREEEADRDMHFVEDFCLKYKIPLVIKEFDTKSYLKEHKGVSVEMACRDLRYNWFKELLEEYPYQRLVTGHNADDNIETFFLNLLRGAGSRGLKGMENDNGYIWRPLLFCHRTEILEYLRERNLNYVVDSSNLKEDYRRNFLRNKIIPLLKSEWKGFDSSLDKSIQNLNSENRIVEDSISMTLPEKGKPLTVNTILAFPAPLLLIKRYIEPLMPFSSTPEEVLAAIRANKPHIRTWKLKKGTLMLRNKKLILQTD